MGALSTHEKGTYSERGSVAIEQALGKIPVFRIRMLLTNENLTFMADG